MQESNPPAPPDHTLLSLIISRPLSSAKELTRSVGSFPFLPSQQKRENQSNFAISASLVKRAVGEVSNPIFQIRHKYSRNSVLSRGASNKLLHLLLIQQIISADTATYVDAERGDLGNGIVHI